MVRLVIFGRQGAGKGTQSVVLSQHYGAPHISTGDMLREAVGNATPIGLEAKSYMDAGRLVPDEVMLGVVEERLAAPDVVAGGFLLDGFPRTIVQAEALFGLTPIDVAVDLVVPVDVVVERISSRRVCSSCGRIYAVGDDSAESGTCEVCGGDVVQRADDTSEAVAKRLTAYDTETRPTIEWFDGKGVLVTVDGLGRRDEVSERLITAIDAALV
ncbi:MAG: adenylate kinase [Acidimicrobiales bacterium]|nr:adenylate kinase [Acidimicrobiales bacterium]